eukprot:m.99964 g.99964  ORF g.99964 m.99964 type:complete len:547 (+) comp51451_c0_seq5:35-1675(+)
MGGKRRGGSVQASGKRSNKPAVVPEFNVDGGDEVLRQYGEWAQKNAFNLAPEVKLASSTLHQRGMVAISDIAPNTPLFRISRKMLLSAETCGIKSQLAELLENSDEESTGEEEEAAGSLPDDDDADSDDSASGSDLSWTPLILALMYEFQRKASPWEPYLKALPAVSALTHPHFWTETERTDLLEGLPLQQLVEEDLENIAVQYDEVVRPFLKRHPTVFSPKVCTLLYFKQLSAILMSYSFTDDVSGRVCMAPMADLLNHSAGRNNARLFYSEDYLEMQAICTIPSGQEVFNTYGNLSNTVLYRRYGFVEAHNTKYESVHVFVPELLSFLPANLKAKGLEERKIELLLKCRLVEQDLSVQLRYLAPLLNTRFDPTVPNIPERVFNVFRVLNLTSAQFKQFESLFLEEGVLSVSDEEVESEHGGSEDDEDDDEEDGEDVEEGDEDADAEDDDYRDNNYTVPVPQLVLPKTATFIETWYDALPKVDKLARATLHKYAKQQLEAYRTVFARIAAKPRTPSNTLKIESVQIIRAQHMQIFESLVQTLECT